MVSSSSRQSATTPWVSIAEWVCTWVRNSPSTMISASRKPASTSPRSLSMGPRTLPSCGMPLGPPPPPAEPAMSTGPGKTSGASFLRASSMSTTKGSGS